VQVAIDLISVGVAVVLSFLFVHVLAKAIKLILRRRQSGCIRVSGNGFTIIKLKFCAEWVSVNFAEPTDCEYSYCGPGPKDRVTFRVEDKILKIDWNVDGIKKIIWEAGIGR
jgi:hypothetical protein